MDNKENKITVVLQNFIEELSKGYELTKDEREVLETLAQEDTTKLYNQKEVA
jgi:hypothetical protein